MSQLLYLVLFGIFVILIVIVRFTRSHGRSAVTLLVLYIISVHVLLAVTRRDAWPFVSHGAFFENADARRPFTNVRFVGVDALGRESEIDPRAWSPLSDRTLDIWFLIQFARLTPENQRQVTGFLLDKAERARRDGQSRLLRFITAPQWYSLVAPHEVPAAPYVGLRVYLVRRTPIVKASDGSETTTLLGEFLR
jgi:hypothetical protein